MGVLRTCVLVVGILVSSTAMTLEGCEPLITTTTTTARGQCGTYCKCWETPTVCEDDPTTPCSCGRSGPSNSPSSATTPTPTGVTTTGQRFMTAELLTTTAAPDPIASAFDEDFSSGQLDPGRWRVFRKRWGLGNNGLTPSLVSFVNDVVEPSKPPRLVLSLGAVGDIPVSDGSVRGLDKVAGRYMEQTTAATRVGSGICTAAEYASGVYSVVMKVPQGDFARGIAPSIWTFHYEEHRADPTKNSNDVNVNDLLYRWRAKVNGDGYFYSTVNSEVDWPELGRSGVFNQGRYTTYLSERELKTRSLSMPGLKSFDDGNYHRWTLEWRTEMQPSTCNVVLPHAGLDGQLYCAEAPHPHQGFPLKQRVDGGYDVYTGKSLRYLVDGVEIGSETAATAPISAVAARICVAAWLPAWAGPAPFQRSEIRIAGVSAEPFNDEGDIYWQPETYPVSGLV